MSRDEEAAMKAHQARKRFGQNFLVDRAVIAAIVKAIAPQPDDAMVEIGPGLAALTEPLIEAREARVASPDGPHRPLHAIELDRDLARRLAARFTDHRLVIHQADALSFDFATLVLAGPRPTLRVVGNLPYNISTPLLFHLLDHAALIVDQHFMLQKEVVARMVADPGTSDYGRLSVMLQVSYDMESLFDVPPEAFDPPPKVTSAIVRMIPLPPASSPIRDRARFARLVTLAFSQRRKMLRNTLEAHAEAMEAVGIVPTARAEEIAPETYVALANHGLC
jgi:16S rRNA (adenine1518-N6/adenine1519-N6)-dimethyltransferase